jgi:uncharacterized protein YecE (DUF72 family)
VDTEARAVVREVRPITSDFTYIRFLGDRKGIEQQTKVWDKIIIDRHTELSEWAGILGKIKIPSYVYANNHYAGYGPATVEMFQELWRRHVKKGPKTEQSATLFPM